ncbi:ChaN family lipoprotein [Geomonas subterranea]|uniref:ChaN family lipoprotein n=1 Tax=Geomonas subterranea TaxID=2847989 RepID=A0ABX8LI96_9BACT|nr:ChaN family lipoprotein [Geomonas subterranea]QXE91758.1 ChaN family lipoprotein [Geomonas subterranea]QXM10149.1 ChaN family lipoprotein [Geomonas subterranea]
MPIRRAATLLFLFLLTLLTCGCSITQALRVRDHERVDVQSMIADLSGSPVLFLGERHDASAHHELQLRVLEALKAQGKDLVIGMEMFEKVSQPALDAWSAGRVPESAFRKVYQWSWRHIPWGMYSDIFFFARDNHIPIVALNAPRGIVQNVAQRGFGSLSAAELADLPPDVDARVTDQFLNFMRGSFPSHGRSGDAYRHIAEAQMLRNMVMARRINDYMAAHPKKVMVVIAGGGHARGVGGVPAELRGNLDYKIVLPPVPPLDEESVTPEDADYLLVERF